MRSAIVPLLVVVLGGCMGPRLVGPLDSPGRSLPAPVVREVAPSHTLPPAPALAPVLTRVWAPARAPVRAPEPACRPVPVAAPLTTPRFTSPRRVSTGLIVPRVAGLRVRAPADPSDCAT